MVEFSTILSFIQAGGIIVGVTYYIQTLRNQSRTRKAQLFMQLFEGYRQKSTWREGFELIQMEWTDNEDFFNKYDSSINLDNYEKRYSLWSFFDGIGMLMKKGLVDKEMIYYLMGGYNAYWQWNKFGDIIKESRVRMKTPDHFVMFEYLGEEMRKMKEERNHEMEIPSHWGALSLKK